MKLSVAIATFNEERNIKSCLESIHNWVDEIIIIDGSSTDNTVEIAKKFKTAVYIFDNPSIFHLNKQRAIDACTGEWILQLDADEVVTEELKKEIIEVINREQINGFWIPRKNFFLGKFLKKGGQYPDYTLRLYRRGKGRLPCKSVHEQAVVEGRTEYLKNPLLHYPHPDFSDYLKHFNRYTDIFADELQENKVETGWKSLVFYMLMRPIHWFILSFVRHKGFMDGFAGFVFSLFSSLRFPVAYLKYWDKERRQKIAIKSNAC